jgi:hypothetical protein
MRKEYNNFKQNKPIKMEIFLYNKVKINSKFINYIINTTQNLFLQIFKGSFNRIKIIQQNFLG